MFSTGQLLFAGFFILVFAGILILAYGRDRKLHKRYYRGVQWVGISFVTFIIIIFIIKYLLKS